MQVDSHIFSTGVDALFHGKGANFLEGLVSEAYQFAGYGICLPQ